MTSRRFRMWSSWLGVAWFAVSAALLVVSGNIYGASLSVLCVIFFLYAAIEARHQMPLTLTMDRVRSLRSQTLGLGGLAFTFSSFSVIAAGRTDESVTALLMAVLMFLWGTCAAVSAWRMTGMIKSGVIPDKVLRRHEAMARRRADRG